MQRRDFFRGATAMAFATSIPQLTLSSTASSMTPNISSRPLRRMAFGSCNRQSRNQFHWRYIASSQPDLWYWLGDNIYAEYASPNERADQYQKILNHPDYQRLGKLARISGVWDDHDYGGNNVGIDYEEKGGSQQVFWDFLGKDPFDPIREQEGIFRLESWGPEGQKIDIVSLDVRYFKERPGQGGLLGELQWQWLEETLFASTADFIIIGTGIHLTSRITGLGLEGWNQYPEERRRLYEILAQLDQDILVLTGDRHMAEIIRRPLPGGKALYEIMSSGLTHSVGVRLPEIYRVGDIVGEKNFGLLEFDWDSGSRPKVIASIQSAESVDSLSRHVLDYTSEF